MSARVVIVGGGITGLSVLHFLTQKTRAQDFQLRLLEAESVPGGCLRSEKIEGGIFEPAAQGFLDNRIETWDLIADTGLTAQVIFSSSESAARYLRQGTQCKKIPLSPQDFFKTDLLTWPEKWRCFQEIFIPRKRNDQEETVFDFGARRLGPAFAERFLDPMCRGIYACSARDLSLVDAFPRMRTLEKTYGSLFKGLIAQRRSSKKQHKGIGGHLCSFRTGMIALPRALAHQHAKGIELGIRVMGLKRGDNGGYRLKTSEGDLMADQVILCAPAWRCAQWLEDLAPEKAHVLSAVTYTPVMVVGLFYHRSDLLEIPRGLGYLVPPQEDDTVLGVLFSDQIFPEQFSQGCGAFRVMLDGRSVVDGRAAEEDLVTRAQEEVRTALGVTARPYFIKKALAKPGIPQYNTLYAQNRAAIRACRHIEPGLYCVGNFWGGVSVNDCIANALRFAEEFQERHQGMDIRNHERKWECGI